jgi:hypothetical protein
MEPATLAESLASALRGLDPERPESIDALRPLYQDDVDFRDPIQHLQGLDAFLAMNRRLLGRAQELSFTVSSAVGDRNSVFLAWTMRAKPKLGPRLSVEGATYATLRYGKVALHRDYWDLAELLTSPVPFAHAAVQLLLKPLA